MGPLGLAHNNQKRFLAPQKQMFLLEQVRVIIIILMKFWKKVNGPARTRTEDPLRVRETS